MSMSDPPGAVRRLDRKLGAITPGRYTPEDFILPTPRAGTWRSADLGGRAARPPGGPAVPHARRILDDMGDLVAQAESTSC